MLERAVSNCMPGVIAGFTVGRVVIGAAGKGVCGAGRG